MKPPELIRILTPDGASLALYRYRPKVDADTRREPVLLISGFGLNRHALDLNERYSLARHFANEGFEAWILELRGSGLSSFARKTDGSFDDYLIDTRAAAAHILEATHAEKLHWVGYSLGGMLLYASLGSGASAWIRSGVAIEAPVDFTGFTVSEASRRLLRFFDRTLRLQNIPYRALIRLLYPVFPLFYRKPLFTNWMNPENINPALMSDLLLKTIDNVPTALGVQFLRWIHETHWRSMDGKTHYLEACAQVQTPLLMMSGVSDFARRASSARAHFKNCEIQTVECVKAQGFSDDYGHADLLFGKNSPEEIYPRISEWVRSQDPAREAARSRNSDPAPIESGSYAE